VEYEKGGAGGVKQVVMTRVEKKKTGKAGSKKQFVNVRLKRSGDRQAQGVERPVVRSLKIQSCKRWNKKGEKGLEKNRLPFSKEKRGIR